jgi:peptidoglycan/xylan/chitin deacetylase (PgdA/CDA1 family)
MNAMISVLASEADQPVVREFFELFKTPWRFHAADAPAKILLCAGREVPANDAALVIIFAGELISSDENTGAKCESQTEPGIFKHDGVELPIYGRRLVEKSSPQIVFRRGQTNGRPFVRIGFDLFAEIRHLLTTGQPAEHAAAPTLERHVAFLRDLILSHSLPLVEIPPRPAGHEFIVCLTHDVDHVGIRNHKFDHTMFGFLYRATFGSVFDVFSGRKNLGQLAQNFFAVLRLPLVHLGLADDFWFQFGNYTALEGGRPSTFFVIPKKGETGLDAQSRRPARRAASYDAADLRDILRRLQAAGKEVAVHGLDAWRDAVAGRAERERIAGLVSGGATGVRMHWLYFDANAPQKLEAAGYVYDSTIGYNQTVGYRAGASQVFKPLTAKNLLELPMHVMDTALFYPSYLNLSPQQADEKVFPLIENAIHFGGVFTVNWHDRSLAPERLWGNFYSHLLDQLSAKKPWFATAAQTVAWFRQRRAATFENGAADDHVKIKLPAASDSLPPLRVRIFQPGKEGAKFSEQAVHDGWETCLAA